MLAFDHSHFWHCHVKDMPIACWFQEDGGERWSRGIQPSCPSWVQSGLGSLQSVDPWVCPAQIWRGTQLKPHLSWLKDTLNKQLFIAVGHGWNFSDHYSPFVTMPTWYTLILCSKLIITHSIYFLFVCFCLLSCSSLKYFEKNVFCLLLFFHHLEWRLELGSHSLNICGINCLLCVTVLSKMYRDLEAKWTKQTYSIVPWKQ